MAQALDEAVKAIVHLNGAGDSAPRDVELVSKDKCAMCLGERRYSRDMLTRDLRGGRITLCWDCYLPILTKAVVTRLEKAGLVGMPRVELFAADILVSVVASAAARKSGKTRPDSGFLEMTVEIARRFVDDVRSKILEEAWGTLPDEQRMEMTRQVGQFVVRQASRGAVEAHVRAVFADHVDDLIAEEIGKREGEIAARIAAELEKRWPEMVEQVVSRRVAAAIDKIHAEIAKKG